MRKQMLTGWLCLAWCVVVAGCAAVSADTGGEAGEVFDHGKFDQVVKAHVDADGWVDYKALSEDTGKLDAYIGMLAGAPVDELDEMARLTLLINAYNAFTLRLIADYYPVKSIMDIPEDKRWDDVRWGLGGRKVSLNQIEHEMIRGRYDEPRIHFALVCAAYSCPKLRNEAYTAERLEEQLADQTAYTHRHDRWFQFDRASNTAGLTKLYDWYGQDFETTASGVLDYVAGLVPELREAMDAGRTPTVRWIDYDWRLNDISNAP